MDLNFFKKKVIECSKNKNKLFILGRGFSTSFFLKNIGIVKKNDLIIGFNTNEIINKIDFYFTNKKIIPKNVPKRKLLELKEIINICKNDLRILKIGSTSYSLDPLLFFINKTVQKSNKSLKIVFVGFDFRTSLPDGDYKFKIRKNLIQNQIDISGQRDLFFKRKNSYSKLDIIHTGFDLHSDSDPRDKVFLKKKEKKYKVKIVAEITTNHHGETQKIIDLIYGAKKAGADFVKFQMRDVKNFYSKKILDREYKSPYGTTFRDYRNKLELSDEQIELIFKLCKKLKIEPFFSVLDISSFKKLKKYNLRLLKIPSTISEDKVFLNFVKENYKGEIVVSTGMTNEDYLLECAKLFKKNKKLYLLHCVSSYPTSPLDGNLAIINTIKNLSKKYKNIVPGYSSHDLTRTASAMSVALGAEMIEKHIKLSSNKWAHFDETALDVNYEFPSWVQYVRSSENILGTNKKKILKSEHHKYPEKN